MSDGHRGTLPRGNNQSRATPLLPGAGTPAPDVLPAARIRRPARSVAQSGPGRRRWVLEFEPAGRRPTDPLMGWTGSDDTLAQVRLEFRGLQGAVEFAEKQGWRYEVEEPPARRFRPKNYADQLLRDLAGPPRKPRPPKDSVPSVDPGAGGRTGAATPPPDAVEEAGLDSFPASDPPSWSGVAVGQVSDRSRNPAPRKRRTPGAS